MTVSTWREGGTREGRVRMGPGQAVALRLYQDLGLSQHILLNTEKEAVPVG